MWRCQTLNKLFINNEFIASKSTDTMDVINPATGDKLDTITFATESEVNDAVAKSKQAQLEWEQVPEPTRADYVKLLIPLLEKYKDTLADLYVKEQGKTLASAKGEIDKSIQFIDYMTSLSMSNKGEVLQNSRENETILLTKTTRCDCRYRTLECSNNGLNEKSHSRCYHRLLCCY